MRKLHPVELTDAEREQLHELTRTGTAAARRIRRARTLLLAGQGLPDARIADAVGCCVATVENLRRRFARDRLGALDDRPRPGAARILDSKGDGRVGRVGQEHPAPGTGDLEPAAVGRAPGRAAGRRRHLRGDRAPHAQKKRLKPWLKQRWCLPEVSGAYVARMEDVLDLYAAPPDPVRPIICLDELPLPLRDHVRPPLPPAPGAPAREDYEYKRCGTACLAMAFDPHRGWRHVWAGERRTKADFAGWVRELVEVYYPQAEVIRLVTDNLNTHGPGAFYEAFPAAEARRLAQKIEWHFIPKHGSWLNMVEIELAVLSDQCLDRRLPDLATVAAEVAAWEAERNAARATIDWRFTTDQARTKLHRLYPFGDPDNPQ